MIDFILGLKKWQRKILFAIVSFVVVAVETVILLTFVFCWKWTGNDFFFYVYKTFDTFFIIIPILGLISCLHIMYW